MVSESLREAEATIVELRNVSIALPPYKKKIQTKLEKKIENFIFIFICFCIIALLWLIDHYFCCRRTALLEHS